MAMAVEKDRGLASPIQNELSETSKAASSSKAERERPLHELLSTEMVNIYVGIDNTHWTLHEKLLCHRSRFFRHIFYNKRGLKTHTYGLPDEEDEPFTLFVGWLYSGYVPTPTEEKHLGALFELHLMGEKWEMPKMIVAVLDAVRRWYHDSHTWPSLRRVQYIYANTDVESPMRQLLVSCVARMLVLGDGIPAHWENALRKNGQLAVDVILCVQKWGVREESVPDAREESVAGYMDEAEQTAGAEEVQRREKVETSSASKDDNNPDSVLSEDAGA